MSVLLFLSCHMNLSKIVNFQWVSLYLFPSMSSLFLFTSQINSRLPQILIHIYYIIVRFSLTDTYPCITFCKNAEIPPPRLYSSQVISLLWDCIKQFFWRVNVTRHFGILTFEIFISATLFKRYWLRDKM